MSYQLNGVLFGWQSAIYRSFVTISVRTFRAIADHISIVFAVHLRRPDAHNAKFIVETRGTLEGYVYENNSRTIPDLLWRPSQELRCVSGVVGLTHCAHVALFFK